MIVALIAFAVSFSALIVIIGWRIIKIRRGVISIPQTDDEINITIHLNGIDKKMLRKSISITKAALSTGFRTWFHTRRHAKKTARKIGREFLKKTEAILKKSGVIIEEEKTLGKQLSGYKKKIHKLRDMIQEEEEKKLPKF